MGIEGTSRPPWSWLRATVSAVLAAAACGDRDAPSRAGAWEFKVDTMRSEADAGVRQTSWLRVVGKEGPEGEPRTAAVILSFDCLPGNASSTIMTDQSLRQGTVETRITVDSEPPRPIPGFAGTTPTSGQVVLTMPQESVLAILSGHQRAVIEYADGAGSSRTVAEFPLAGLEQYRGPFLAACAERGEEEDR